MILKDLMVQWAAKGITPNPTFEGSVTNDDYITAFATRKIGDFEEVAEGKYEDYVVIQDSVESVDAQNNAEFSDKNYIREGKSSTKTNQQRTFAVSGDRYVGSDFQDYVFSHEIIFGTAEDVVVPYIRFCIRNGVGEKGKVAIAVNSDSGGPAGESATFDAELKQTGGIPEKFNYITDVVTVPGGGTRSVPKAGVVDGK